MVILDKDGKPCKTCNSYDAFATAAGAATGAAGASRRPLKTMTLPAECPPDVEALGRATWTFLHTMAAQYPERPSPNQQKDMSTFLNIFSNVYPCWHCASDLRDWMAKPGNEPKLETQGDLGLWLCRAHNEVNAKLMKPRFDCSKWLLRWRDGWPDGRCDP